jgi:hypothetical protein
MEVLDPDSSSRHADRWLQHAYVASQNGQTSICVSSLNRLFEKKIAPKIAVKNFVERSPSERRSLMDFLLEEGVAVSLDTAYEIIAELMKTDLEMSREKRESIQAHLKNLNVDIRNKVGLGLANQSLLALRHVTASFTYAKAQLKKALAEAQRAATQPPLYKLLAYIGKEEKLYDLIRLTLFYLQPYAKLAESFDFVKDCVKYPEFDHTSGKLFDAEPKSKIWDIFKRDGHRLLPTSIGKAFENALIRHTDVFRSMDEKWQKELQNQLLVTSRSLEEMLSELVRLADEAKVQLEADPQKCETVLEKIHEGLAQISSLQNQVLDFVKKFEDLWTVLDILSQPYIEGEAKQMSMDMLDSMDMSSIEELSKRLRPQERKIKRYTRVDFPGFCALDQKTELRVQLTKDAPLRTRILQELFLTARKDIKEISVDVVVTAPGFALQQPHKPMLVPVEGDSKEICFYLYAVEIGEQIVELEFFQDSTRIGHIMLKTTVTKSKHEFGFRSHARWIRDPGIGLDPLLRAKQDEKYTLHVTWTEKEGRLLFQLPSSKSKGELWERTGGILRSEIEGYLKELNAFLIEVVTIGNPSPEDWRSISLNINAIGETLYKAILPEPLAAITRSWKHGTRLSVSTNEQWVPWELMFDGEAFWGEKFVLTRYPRPSDPSMWPEEDEEPEERSHINKVVNVIGGGLADTERLRAEGLFNSISAGVEVKTLVERTVAELSELLSGANVLHCTCHGHLEPHILQLSTDKSRIRNLLPDSIKRLPLQPGAFVFANACCSSAPVLLFGRFNSFGWEFYLKGAEAFVGTLGAVPSEYAMSFAEDMYRELLKTDVKATVAEAFASARLLAKKKKNWFWLLYCMYGDPDYTLAFKNLS